ncbi:MAG: histidinol dehydrogenase, partial [Burkholderiales bacterium]|nr:histidinol dehydrogenase [Burkholderiales bacterium]
MSQVSVFSTRDDGFEARLARLLAFENTQDASIDAAVAAIVDDVRQRGDAAVLEYTHRFDRVQTADAAALELPKSALEQAFADLTPARREALVHAAGRIRTYHERQVAQSWSYTDAEGNRLGQKITALDRAGIYVPGGKASYPSSVLMNALPARVAGVPEIIMVTPTPEGERNQLVLAAAAVCGVNRVFTIGGAQAVAALAYGTQTIPKVDKIVGPGNAYVAAAKRRVFGVVGIDMLAGPSEILVICDGSTNPDWVAMDLFAQAEHDEMAQAILLSPDEGFVRAVQQSIERQLEEMPRRAVIAASLSARGALIVVRDLEEACEIANRIAPEHLELSVADPERWLPRVHHAGAIFLGRYASESL